MRMFSRLSSSKGRCLRGVEGSLAITCECFFKYIYVIIGITDVALQRGIGEVTGYYCIVLGTVL